MIFTSLVIVFSIFVSLYLGLFDYVFTNALGRGLELLPGQAGNLDVNMADIEKVLAETPVPNEIPLGEAPLNLQ